MTFLTDFADQAVVLPLALVIALAMALIGWARGALVWLTAVVGTFGVIALLKIILAACGPVHIGGEIQSPSGHTAAAAIVYGGLIALIVRRCGMGICLAFLPAPVVVLLIGLSRIELGAHTPAEVVIGGLVGCVGTLAMLLLVGAPPLRFNLRWIVGPAVIVAVAMHGYHLNAEDGLREIGGRFAWLAAVCGVHGRL